MSIIGIHSPIRVDHCDHFEGILHCCEVIVGIGSVLEVVVGNDWDCAAAKSLLHYLPLELHERDLSDWELHLETGIELLFLFVPCFLSEQSYQRLLHSLPVGH